MSVVGVGSGPGRTASADEIASAHACAALTLSFFEALDAGDYDACMRVFTADAVWERKGRALEGLPAIRNEIEARPPGRRTCHVIGNVQVEFDTADACRVKYCLVTWQGTATEGAPVPVAQPGAVRRCVDQLRRTPDGWRIARKQPRIVLDAPRA